jgi:hypothetical protein
MFCAPGLIFIGTEGVRSRFHLLRAPPRFRRCRGCRVSYSCFPRPKLFPAVPWESGPVFMFCVPEIIFGGTEGARSRFHVLRARTRFRRYRGSRVPFSCFVRPKSFSAVPRAPGPVFMFLAPGLVFGGTVGVGFRSHVLRSVTYFWQCRVRLVPFSCFACPNSILTVTRASGPVSMFFSAGLVFDGVEGVGSRFHFCVLGLIFVSTEGVPSRFHVSRSRTCFQRYRGRRVPFSCFALPDSF